MSARLWVLTLLDFWWHRRYLQIMAFNYQKAIKPQWIQLSQFWLFWGQISTVKSPADNSPTLTISNENTGTEWRPASLFPSAPYQHSSTEAPWGLQNQQSISSNAYKSRRSLQIFLGTFAMPVPCKTKQRMNENQNIFAWFGLKCQLWSQKLWIPAEKSQHLYNHKL